MDTFSLAVLGFVLGFLLVKIFENFNQHKKSTATEKTFDKEKENLLVIDIEYIPEQNTYYAYNSRTGQFLTQSSDPEDLGYKIGHMIPKNVFFTIGKVERVNTIRNPNEN